MVQATTHRNGANALKKLLWVGDAGVPSGFAKATHQILDVVRDAYDVTVLGINYRGDPHPYPYPIYLAAVGGDAFGVRRLVWMCDLVKPDMIVIQNDGWNVPLYVQQLRKFKEYDHVPIVAIVAVDGKNFRKKWLDGVSLAIFWTQFALDEARDGGYEGPAAVIPLGVDLDVYRPMDKIEVRRKRLPEPLHDAFIVGNVNRNQPRKRWDLTVKYFTEWIRSKNVRNAYLYLQPAPTGDVGCDVRQLMAYYGVVDRLALASSEMFYGVSENDMAETYNCFDVQISTTQGEGFGLTTFEGMACGVPQIVPDWAALGELCKGAAGLVRCSTTAVGPPYENVIGGVADEAEFVKDLHRLYLDSVARQACANAGLKRVAEDRFRWANIGQRYIEELRKVVCPHETVMEVTTHVDARKMFVCTECRKTIVGEMREAVSA